MSWTQTVKHTGERRLERPALSSYRCGTECGTPLGWIPSVEPVGMPSKDGVVGGVSKGSRQKEMALITLVR